MSNSKTKLRYKIMAVALSVMMLVAMVPATVLTSALGNTDPAYDYLAAQDLTATYTVDGDKINVSWSAIGGAVDALSVSVNGGAAEALAADATSYTTAAADYAGKTVIVSLTATCGENSRTAEAYVSVPATLSSVRPVPKMYVENHSSLESILAKLPSETLVMVENSTEPMLAPVIWSADGVNYDRDLSTEQTFEVKGYLTLPETILNRNNVTLTTSVNVIVTTAVDVTITTNLDQNGVEKMAGESLLLFVEAEGTLSGYQWYYNHSAIDGATNSYLTIDSLSPANGGNYYCLVSGKNGSSVVSNIVTVNVSKCDTAVVLTIDPIDGQTRPQGITLQAVGIPADAEGELVFFAGNTEIGKATLPATSINFYANGDVNDYSFTVEYKGDDRYNGSTSAAMDYNFSKGTIAIHSINSGLTGTAGQSATLFTPTATLTPHSSAVVTYTYEIDNTDIATVDANGRLTYKKAGVCNLTITAKANENYNDATIVIPVTVNLADNSNLYFKSQAGKTTYTSGFSYVIPYINSSKGEGALSVSIESAFSDYLVATLDAEHNRVVITYTDAIDATDPSLTQVLTGDVKIKLTKDSDEVYNSISAEYTLTIDKGRQDGFYFPSATVIATYGTESATGKQEPISRTFVQSEIVYGTTTPDLVSVAADGTYTALKPGTAVITATKPGNGLYADAECSFNLIIQKGTVPSFGFEEAIKHSPFGAQFAGNVPFTTGESAITYSISYLDPALTDSVTGTIYVSVDANTGVVSFNGRYYAAANKKEYTITVKATRAACDYYNEASATYTLIFDRQAIADADYVLDGADLLGNGNILSNFGDEGNTAEGITITPVGDYEDVRFYINKDIQNISDWSDKLFLSEEGKFELTFYLRKANGEVTQSITKSVTLDEQGPNDVTITMREDRFQNGDDSIHGMWSGFTGALSFELFTNTGKEVIVDAADALSPIHEIYYYIQTEDFTDVENDAILEYIKNANFDWTLGTVQKNLQGRYETKFLIELPENTTKKVVVFIKVVDAARNVSYFRSNGVVFDNIAPTYNVEELPDSVIDITLPSIDGQVGLYNDDIKFDVTIKDEAANGITSGIKAIKITVEGIGSYGEQYKKETLVTANRSEITEFHAKDMGLANFAEHFTVQGDFIIPKSFNSNYLSILVEVWDYAGNYCSNENKRTYLAMDSIQPQIEVTYNDYDLNFSNDKYLGNGQHRVASIVVTELNFDPSKVDFSRILLDGKTLEVAPVFTCIGSDIHGDGLIWLATIDFSKDGDYSFNVSATDKAKNKSNGWDGDDVSLNKFWTIDSVKPTIHVAMTNANAQNGNYFSDVRVATITITERNFSKDYSFDWSDVTYYLDGIKMTAPQAKWVESNAETYEHVYILSFTADGDYTFGVSYTDLADNVDDGYTCNGVSYKSFTVDTTAPVININGVADKTAYNDVVAPIVTYADLNSDGGSLSVRLTGVKNGVVNYKRTEDTITYGMMLAYNNFERKQWVDDIYTLSVSLADKAGNFTSKTVTFSVNRFGSTYDLSLLTDILGKYLREEQDIVFTETNVNELDHESLLIKMIKDGTPTALVEGTDYTLEKTGGDGAWSVYKYTIKKDLFATDGHYTISVYSEDAAGNVNENDSDSKKADISFAIDKTTPVIVPLDLEDDTPYAMDNKKVSVEIKDNLMLDGVKILLNGKEVDYTVDGDTYIFDISKSNNKQGVEIVAVDAAGNTQPIEVKNILVNSNFFVRWYNNTTLFVSSLAGVVLLILVLTALALFGKKKEQ